MRAQAEFSRPGKCRDSQSIPIRLAILGFKGGIRNGARRDSWYPTLRKEREGPRISYYAAPNKDACAAFYEESRMKFVDPTKPCRKSGGMGHPQICWSVGLIGEFLIRSRVFGMRKK
jgi:hypothetical protein